MATYNPISLSVPQYMDSNGDPYSGAVLKAYESGTSTVLPMATTRAGTTTATSVALNSSGYPEVSGTIVIPHVNKDYKLALYPTQTAADADSGADWTIDNLSAQLKEIASITDFSVVGDDATDNHDNIVLWLNYLMSSGKRGFVPAGDYKTSVIAYTTLTGDIDIECERGATFKYHSAESAPLFSLKHGTREIYGIRWTGGTIDNADGDFAVAENSNTCLYFTRLKHVQIHDVHFKGESTYGAASTTTTGTDSGISTVDCVRMTVSSCVFEGQGDAGLYLSGNSANSDETDDGGEYVVVGNHFVQCQQALTAKRECPRVIFTGNTVRESYAGVTMIEVTSIDPARNSIICDNTFKKIETRAIELKQQKNFVVSGNVIEDFGYQADGTSIGTIPNAIRVLGASDSIISGNRIFNSAWTKHANHIGIRIDDEVINSVTYTPANITCRDNHFSAVTIGIDEQTTGVCFYYANTYDSTVDTPLNGVQADSTIQWPNTGHVWNQYADTGNVGAGEDTLHTFTLPANVLNVNGRSIRIIMWGTTANNANAKTLKLYFGSIALISKTLTTSQLNRWVADAVVVKTGASTQKATLTFHQTNDGGGGTELHEVVSNTTLTETDTAAIAVKTTGTAVSDDDILANVSVIQMLN